MKQLIQSFKSGTLEIIEVPTPKVSSNTVLIDSACSLISVGTERMLVEFAKASLLEKARKQPRRLKQVIQKIGTDGLLATFDVVQSKLSEPIPMGYSNVGRVIDIGRNVEGLTKGDRVISNGSHAEKVIVPRNFVARIPDNVDDETASFAVVGSIALQGIRLLNPTLGEHIAVLGLGLVGQMAIQLLLASGCRVLGVDPDEKKVKIADKFGIEGFVLQPGLSPVETAMAFSRGRGVDGVLITASTSSNEPIEHSAQMSRSKGRIVLVGETGLNIPRDLFYEKELSFQVSSSYGPGRYDAAYGERGVDYPLAYVRWTAQRNFEAVLDMMSSGNIQVKPLIDHRIPFSKAIDAYDILLKENPLGIILEYNEEEKRDVELIKLVEEEIKKSPQMPVIGYIGVGNFAKTVLLPLLKKTDASLKTIASSGGLSGVIGGRRYGFQYATSEYENIFKDDDINTVFISTRHNSHASLVIAALRNDKNVFVEKPLALNRDELREIVLVHRDSPGILMVGFNRRFSPFTRKLKKSLAYRKDPICVNVVVNAGELSPDHWVHDPAVGGGRVIGEVCHFIDLMRFIIDSSIGEISSLSTRGHSSLDEDKIVIHIGFEDGSIGSVSYFANGNKRYPKERIEVFSEGRVFLIDNFKSLKSYGSRAGLRLLKQDKGHRNEIEEFIKAVKGGMPSPIPFDELVEITLSSFLALESARIGEPLRLSDIVHEILA